MKRVLCLTVLAVLACSNKAATYSGDTTGPTTTTPPRAAVAPSDLSPEQVRLVQRSLIDRGFAVDPTGTFDDRTQTALMDFQRARGLPPSAALDQPTIDALGLDPRDVMPVRGTAPAPARGSTSEQPGAPASESGGQTPGVSPYDPSNSGQPDSSHPSSGDKTDQ